MSVIFIILGNFSHSKATLKGEERSSLAPSSLMLIIPTLGLLTSLWL